MKIYTIGYEKRNIEEYVAALKESEVKILIDVREIAWSYKRDFCKSKLQTALSEVGIRYIHVKELGNPKHLRKSGQKVVELLAMYKTYLQNTESGIIDLRTILSKAKEYNLNICLTCYERDHRSCHRSIIIDHIAPSVDKIQIVHL